ncbi:hypothetical protein EX30DRAFT_227530 [Ascodesmis nigricans]|uniref:Uncharacterized protein n=1 Tax=Ascodesmis nigricans TaxID=341454 RepID=A0A4S2MIV3_9PEZI|nr:hypothetical protein EX30DRAFT_227530 [Ascodesmis nigricans]
MPVCTVDYYTSTYRHIIHAHPSCSPSTEQNIPPNSASPHSPPPQPQPLPASSQPATESTVITSRPGSQCECSRPGVDSNLYTTHSTIQQRAQTPSNSRKNKGRKEGKKPSSSGTL